MARPLRRSILAVAVIALSLVAPAQDRPGKRAGAWSAEEALTLLARQPNDAYLQYVAVQAGRREGQLQQAVGRVAGLNRRDPFGGGRSERADLFSTFTGALAVQESLQLDTLAGEEVDRQGGRFPVEVPKAPEDPDEKQAVPKSQRGRARKVVRALLPKTVPIDSLTGPTVKSHPWEQMLAGRKAEVGPLAKCVPEDYYLVEFKSAGKLMQALSTADVWGDHIFTQMLGQSTSQDTERRLKRQLGIAGIPPEVLDAAGVEGIGLTGSDLYLADGSDLTLLVLGRNVVTMRLWADGMLNRGGGATRAEGEHGGVKYTHARTADGEVNVYAADPRPDLHVRGNSLPAIRRVLDAVAGKGRRLGDSAEYAYIRTILPRDAAEEDGLVYLSDPCIRRLVGPRVKLGQRRRLIAYNHLKMVEHAALMFRTEAGRAPKSFEELAESGCAPGVFGKDKLACPGGGAYTLSADGMSATSSVYGRPGQLTPLIEVPIDTVSDAEAAAYKQFLDGYNQYWRTFFDPIAVRVRVTPQQYRLETVILPLIDNSIYTSLAAALGGRPVALDTQPSSKKTVITLAARLNKQPLLDMLPPDPQAANPAEGPGAAAALARSANNLRMLALALHNYEASYQKFPPAAVRSADGKQLLSWRVSLLPFLEQADLYQQFKLDEPWDSEHNKKLSGRMPAVFAGRDPKPAAAGKTPFLAPVGPKTMFPPDGQTMQFKHMMDGSSSTILFLEATDDHAVVWTKPDDLVVDLEKPLKGLTGPGRDSFLSAKGDGSLLHLRGTVPAKEVVALFTRDGNEVLNIADHELPAPGARGGSPIPFDLAKFADVSKLRRFLRDGIGDEFAIHVHDAAQPINADITNAFGTGGTVMPFGGQVGARELLLAGLVVKSLTNPVCVRVPVKDAKAVDDFLTELDRVYAEYVANSRELFFRPEYYQTTLGGQRVRCLAFKLFGISLRFFWGRVGDALVIVNHPSVFDDLTETAPQRAAAATTGHALLRVRAENWNAVLPVYRLGWAEGHRAACQGNQGRVAAVARGWPELLGNGRAATSELLAKVTQLYGVRPYCPDGGRYSCDGKECTCSIHGGWNDRRQPAAPADESATAKTVRTFAGLSATLTFLDDGLHAVVTIDRKPAKGDGGAP